MSGIPAEIDLAFATVAGLIPGATCDCAWRRLVSSGYDPETGGPVDVTSEVRFRGIRSTYRHHQVIEGVRAGDFPLYINAKDVPACPKAGDTLSWDGEEYAVVNAQDDARLLYTLQMRRK